MNINLTNQLSKLIDVKVNSKNTNNSILVIDRGNIDPIIRSSLVAQILNKIKNLNVSVLTEKNKDWVFNVYRGFGIKNFIRPIKLNKIFNYPLIGIKFLFIFFKENLNVLLFDFRWMIDNFKVLDIQVGDLIYDSYVRYNHKFLKPKKQT